MAVGRQPGKQQLDAFTANVAAGFLGLFSSVEQAQEWLAGTTSAELEGMGYDTDDVYLLQLIFQKLDQIRAFVEGGPLPTDVYDLRQQLIKVAGPGGGQ